MASFQAVQFATLLHLIKRLEAVKGAILPKGFAPAFRAVALNRVEPGRGIHPDLLGLGSTRAGDAAFRRAARQSLVLAVYFRAERDGILLTEARAAVFPPEGRGAGFHRTWQGWQREVAQSRSLPIEQIGDDARKAARGIGDAQHYDLDRATVAEYWELAWQPR